MKHKASGTDQDYTDPVCGMKLSYKTAPSILEYDGEVYCFCSPSCKDAFEKNPERYASKPGARC